MEKTFAKIEELTENVKAYINTKVDNVKLTMAEKISAIIANAVAGLIVAEMFFFFIIFAGIALSFGLGEWIGKTWAGFLVVSCIYLFFGIIIWSFREKIIRLPIMNALIKQLFSNDHEKD